MLLLPSLHKIFYRQDDKELYWRPLCYIWVGVFLFFISGYAKAQDQQPRPNIILIMADDLGFSDIGSYGSEIETPNLDKLAAEGVRFTQFYNNAKCMQTRATMLSGLYHHQTNNLSRSDNNKTIAEILGDAGYETILSGKWHLGNWMTEKDTPPKRGFDHFFGFLGGAINYYTGEDWKTGKNYVRRGYQKYHVKEDFYATDAFTDFGIEQVLLSVKQSAPFFLYLSYNAPHFPLQVPQREIDKYKETYSVGWDNIRQTRYQNMKEMGIINANWKLTERDPLVPAWDELSPEQQHEETLLMVTYAGMIDRMDQQIGRLVDSLESLGQKENTAIIFLSDNGGCASDYNRTPGKEPGPAEALRSYNVEWANVSNTPFRKYKRWVHEGGISTPMIVSWPGKIAKDTLIRTPSHIVDIMPTILDIADVTYPVDSQLLEVEGQSLLPVMDGDEKRIYRPLFWEYRGSRAVRNGAWKLVGERGRGWELYNMEKDRTETLNLANEYPDRVARMGVMYHNWARRVGARSNKKAKRMRLNTRASFTFDR